MQTTLFSCLDCGGMLADTVPIHCTHCQKTYATVAGIPIFVKNLSQYAAAIYKLYYKFILDKRGEIAELHQQLKIQRHRKGSFQTLIQALEFNNEVIKNLIEPISLWVQKEALIQAEKANYTNVVLKDFAYLKRDWSGLEEDEIQFQQLMSALNAPLACCTLPLDRVLVLGAGLGRIAVALRHQFKQVYATDLSFSMMNGLHQLMQDKPIPFYEINYGNIREKDAVAVKHTASNQAILSKDSTATGTLHYFVSDVLQSPFANESLPYILSVYFTDVLPIRLLLPEIERLLQPLGYFIHLGPLGYGNTKQADRYSCEEIKSYLTDQGFKIVYEDFVTTNHLDSKSVLSHTHFNNWIFVAQKQPQRLYTLLPDTRLTLAAGLHYQITGDLDEPSHRRVQVFKANGKSYDLQPLPFEILEQITGILTIQELLVQLEVRYEVEDPTPLLDLIRQLVSIGIIELITPDNLTTQAF
jgi:SAM-dependent methyltransferase